MNADKQKQTEEKLTAEKQLISYPRSLTAPLKRGRRIKVNYMQ